MALLQDGRNKIGRRIASKMRITTMLMIMMRLTTPWVDILTIASASRLLQSAEFMKNGLVMFVGGLLNGYIKIKENND